MCTFSWTLDVFRDGWKFSELLVQSDVRILRNARLHGTSCIILGSLDVMPCLSLLHRLRPFDAFGCWMHIPIRTKYD